MIYTSLFTIPNAQAGRFPLKADVHLLSIHRAFDSDAKSTITMVSHPYFSDDSISINYY